MVEIDKKVINAFNDILDLRGISILQKDKLINLNEHHKKKKLRILHDCEGGDARMVLYTIMVGIEEGWLKIEIDETNPKNKLRYINKLLKMYDKGE